MDTIDRGGWFQPQFFKQLSRFYHIDKKIFTSKWLEGISSIEDLGNARPTQWEALNKKSPSTLAATTSPPRRGPS